MKIKLGKDIEIVTNIYPKLKFINKLNCKYLTGEIDIFDSEDNYRDSFNIKITIPKNYLFQFPKLFELDEKIKQIDNSHIYKDGSCCVCCLQEEDIRKRKGITIIEYISEYVIPFLANILYYRERGEYANGEYKHGIDGVIQYYQELLNKQLIDDILSEIGIITSNKFRRNETCYCGSGLKFKKCHLSIVSQINRLSKNRLLEDICIMKKTLSQKVMK